MAERLANHPFNPRDDPMVRRLVQRCTTRRGGLAKYTLPQPVHSCLEALSPAGGSRDHCQEEIGAWYCPHEGRGQGEEGSGAVRYALAFPQRLE